MIESPAEKITRLENRISELHSKNAARRFQHNAACPTDEQILNNPQVAGFLANFARHCSAPKPVFEGQFLVAVKAVLGEAMPLVEIRADGLTKEQLAELETKWKDGSWDTRYDVAAAPHFGPSPLKPILRSLIERKEAEATAPPTPPPQSPTES